MRLEEHALSVEGPPQLSRATAAALQKDAGLPLKLEHLETLLP